MKILNQIRFNIKLFPNKMSSPFSKSLEESYNRLSGIYVPATEESRVVSSSSLNFLSKNVIIYSAYILAVILSVVFSKKLLYSQGKLDYMKLIVWAVVVIGMPYIYYIYSR